MEWLADERWVPPGPKGLYARARSGLRVVAREDLPAGATVLLPAYIPRSVVRAFRAGDVSVRYYPIEPDLRYPWRAVRDRIDAVEPEAVLFVHYFGFADPAFDDLAGTARAVGATVIEDCARALFARDAPGDYGGCARRWRRSTGSTSSRPPYTRVPLPSASRSGYPTGCRPATGCTNASTAPVYPASVSAGGSARTSWIRAPTAVRGRSADSSSSSPATTSSPAG